MNTRVGVSLKAIQKKRIVGNLLGIFESDDKFVGLSRDFSNELT